MTLKAPMKIYKPKSFCSYCTIWAITFSEGSLGTKNIFLYFHLQISIKFNIKPHNKIKA
jgi:hypothetical protein